MKSIFKQASWLVFAQFLARIVGFFYTIFLARNLGVENFGLYSVVLAYFSLFSSISEFGFNRYLITELAVDKLKIPKLLLSICLLRTTIVSILFAIFAVVLYFLDPEKIRVSLVLLATLAVFPQALAFTIDSIFVALKKLEYSAFAMVGLSFSTAFMGVIFILSGLDIMGAVLTLVFGQIIYFLILWIFLKKQKINLDFKINLKTLKDIAWGSFPYGFIGVLGLLYFKIDTLILNYLKGNYDSGIYSAGYKFLESLIFMPSALSMALFPNIVSLINTDPKRVYRIYIKSTIFLFLVSIIIVGAYLVFLPMIISYFLPQYARAIEVIRILSLTIPFMFMISPQGIILFSDKKFLKFLTVISVFNLIINISLNFYLIPKSGYLGSAWSTLVSDALGFVVFFFYIRVKLLKK